MSGILQWAVCSTAAFATNQVLLVKSRACQLFAQASLHFNMLGIMPNCDHSSMMSLFGCWLVLLIFQELLLCFGAAALVPQEMLARNVVGGVRGSKAVGMGVTCPATLTPAPPARESCSRLATVADPSCLSFAISCKRYIKMCSVSYLPARMP